MICNLRPLDYDKLDLIPALTNYLKSYETQYHIRTEFSVSGDETTMPPRTKIFLFRIMQEALSNVEKHAKADRVVVRGCRSTRRRWPPSSSTMESASTSRPSPAIRKSGITSGFVAWWNAHAWSEARP